MAAAGKAAAAAAASAAAEADADWAERPLEALLAHLIASRGQPHRCLGTRPADGAEAIRRRYRQLALRTHPDKCDHADAGAAFAALDGAFRALLPG